MKRSGRPARRLSLEKRRSIAGILFISPWIVGFLALFLRPLVSSFVYSISDMKITTDGLVMHYSGFSGYLRAFVSDLYFVRYLTAQITSMLYNVPIILTFSLFMAVILNGEFRGRTFVRSVFFLPVIAGSGVVLSIMQGDAMSQSIISGSRSSMLFQTTALQQILLQSGLSQDVVNYFNSILSNIFVLTWKSGLQIVLFLSGLKTIPQPLYEAADIEGATKWEAFWKITFPMISPILILNLIYTIIDGFTDYSNKVMTYIYSFAKMLNFSYSAVLSWIFFLIVFLIVGIAYTIINRRVVYTVD